MSQEDWIYLDVPDSQEHSDYVIMKGARREYIGGFIRYYIPSGFDLSHFKDYLPIDMIAVPQEVDDIFGGYFVEEQQEIQHQTLKTFLDKVERVVDSNFKQPEWLIAEVNSVSGTTHTYLELVDYDKQGKESAKSRGMIFAKNKKILTKFATETGLKISSGMKILVLAKIKFSSLYNAGIEIVDIDSSFTVGQMELKLQEIRTKLYELGEFDRNKSKIESPDFTKIAVISPQEAAGLGDFQTIAKKLEEYSLCQFSYYHATFQGINSVDSIVGAFTQVNKDMNGGAGYDAVVFIRGGGDKSGLYALNNLKIARCVCRFGIPVYVGVGHERDNTILDEVCHTRFATPSMVATYIEKTIVSNAMYAKENYVHIANQSSSILTQAKSMVRSIFDSQLLICKNSLDVSRSAIDSIMETVIHSAKEITALAKSQLDNTLLDITYQDPQKILDRGYALVLDKNNKVKDISRFVANEEVTIKSKDKIISALIK